MYVQRRHIMMDQWCMDKLQYCFQNLWIIFNLLCADYDVTSKLQARIDCMTSRIDQRLIKISLRADSLFLYRSQRDCHNKNVITSSILCSIWVSEILLLMGAKGIKFSTSSNKLLNLKNYHSYGRKFWTKKKKIRNEKGTLIKPNTILVLVPTIQGRWQKIFLGRGNGKTKTEKYP